MACNNLNLPYSFTIYQEDPYLSPIHSHIQNKSNHVINYEF